jgi:minor extracellular serine protease Vpr
MGAVGSGRLNVTRALDSNLIISPHSLVFTLSFDNRTQTKTLHLRTLDGSPVPKLKASFSSNETEIGFDYSITNDILNVKISDNKDGEGNYEGFLIIDDGKTSYRVPVLIHLTKGTLSVDERNGSLFFSLNYPEKWSYAKISLIKAGAQNERTTSIIPEQIRSLPVYEKGEYWILAQIKTLNETDKAYQTILVNQVTQQNTLDLQDTFGIPVKTVVIISVVLIVVALVGLISQRR